ncbi:MAG TPA: hypothetical protein P5145_03090 [Tenuifilaceae bacterium]|nr:hypothetical protein [Tenuifilaceae bacterium]
MKITKKIIYFLSVFPLLSCQYTTFAQEKLKNNEVKGRDNLYIETVIYNKKGSANSKYFENKKYNLSEIHKQRVPDSPGASFLIYRLNSHEAFINAFYNSFSQERITNLSKQNLDFEVNFVLDKKGKILGIAFRISGESDISVFEIESLEKELETNITFQPIGRSGKEYPGEYPVRTSFKEIEQGKVNAILNQDERIDNWYIFK